MSAILWTSKEIADATEGTCTGDWQATGVSIDSRTVKAGDFFIALSGPTFDGHDFVKAALDKGACGALVSTIPQDVDSAKCVVVADTFTGLQKLGSAARTRSRAKIIAVTGSVGKTGCKEALRQVLGAQAPTYASVGSFNNHWGVPLTLARMPRSCTYAVIEMGMNHVGELGPLSHMVRPHIALITTIAPVHIANFKDVQEIAGAKAEIFEGLGTDGHAVLNADNEFIGFLTEAALKREVRHVHSFGTKGKDARLDRFDLQPDASVVQATIMGWPLHYKVNAPGEHWVMNSLAVMLCAALAGADLDKAAQTLGTLELAQGRGVARDINTNGGSFTLIDESYNASPIAVEMALRVLGKRTPKGKGRRLLALGDMRELGEHSQKLHLALLQPILDAGVDKVFCCGEHMKHLFDALPADKKGAYAFTSDALAPLVAAAIMPDDIITIKGSHSVAMEKVVAALEKNANSSHTENQKTAHG